VIGDIILVVFRPEERGRGRAVMNRFSYFHIINQLIDDRRAPLATNKSRLLLTFYSIQLLTADYIHVKRHPPASQPRGDKLSKEAEKEREREMP
jgi:hypothetical protein